MTGRPMSRTAPENSGSKLSRDNPLDPMTPTARAQKQPGVAMKTSSSTPYRFFMLGLCVFSLSVLAAQLTLQLNEQTDAVFSAADTLVCVVFLADFVVSLWRAKSKWQYLRTWGWLDLLSSIPTVGVLRLGRAARIARIVRVLRVGRASRDIGQFALARRAETTLFSILILALLVLTFGSVAVVHFESDGPGNIETAADALWWTVATISTVGYGDVYPATMEGRLLGALVILVGVGLFGTITAFLSSWFMGPDERAQAGEMEQIRRELTEIRLLLERNAA